MLLRLLRLLVVLLLLLLLLVLLLALLLLLLLLMWWLSAIFRQLEARSPCLRPETVAGGTQRGLRVRTRGRLLQIEGELDLAHARAAAALASLAACVPLRYGASDDLGHEPDCLAEIYAATQHVVAPRHFLDPHEA
jgi:hypothetical protein